MLGIQCIEHDPGIDRACQDIDGEPLKNRHRHVACKQKQDPGQQRNHF